MPRMPCRGIGGIAPSQKLVAVFLQPTFGLGVIRAKPRHFVPESRGVVQMPDMSEFMQDHVITNPGWHLDQTPVEGEDTSRRTGSPSGPLVAYLDPRDLDFMEGCEFECTLGKIQNRAPAQFPFQKRSQILACTSQSREDPRSDGHLAAVLVAGDGCGNPVQPDRGPRTPFGRRMRTGGTDSQPGFHPGMMSLDEGFRLGPGAPARNGATERAVALQGDPVVAGTRVRSEPDDSRADFKMDLERAFR